MTTLRLQLSLGESVYLGILSDVVRLLLFTAPMCFRAERSDVGIINDEAPKESVELGETSRESVSSSGISGSF